MSLMDDLMPMEGHDKGASIRQSKRRIDGWRTRLAVQFEALLAQAKEEGHGT